MCTAETLQCSLSPVQLRWDTETRRSKTRSSRRGLADATVSVHFFFIALARVCELSVVP